MSAGHLLTVSAYVFLGSACLGRSRATKSRRLRCRGRAVREKFLPVRRDYIGGVIPGVTVRTICRTVRVNCTWCGLSCGDAGCGERAG